MTTATPEPEGSEELVAPETPASPTLPEDIVVEETVEEITQTTGDFTTVEPVEETVVVTPEPPAAPAAAPIEAAPAAAAPEPPAPPARPTAPAVVVAAPKPTHTPDGQPISPKSRLIAVLLCFFLGAIGIHSFYAGKNTNGIIQIVITVVTLGTLGWVWPLIDFIMLLVGSYKDKDGQLILNWDA